MAQFLTIVVRNAIEPFHAAHLSDAEMRKLNHLIRNAIFTALHAAVLKANSKTVRVWVGSQLQHIPPYWEQPELLPGYRSTLERSDESADTN